MRTLTKLTLPVLSALIWLALPVSAQTDVWIEHPVSSDPRASIWLWSQDSMLGRRDCFAFQRDFPDYISDFCGSDVETVSIDSPILAYTASPLEQEIVVTTVVYQFSDIVDPQTQILQINQQIFVLAQMCTQTETCIDGILFTLRRADNFWMNFYRGENAFVFSIDAEFRDPLSNSAHRGTCLFLISKKPGSQVNMNHCNNAFRHGLLDNFLGTDQEVRGIVADICAWESHLLPDICGEQRLDLTNSQAQTELTNLAAYMQGIELK